MLRVRNPLAGLIFVLALVLSGIGAIMVRMIQASFFAGTARGERTTCYCGNGS